MPAAPVQLRSALGLVVHPRPPGRSVHQCLLRRHAERPSQPGIFVRQCRVSGRPPPRILADLRDATYAALIWCSSATTDFREECRALFDVHHSILNGGFQGLVDNPSGNEVPRAIEGAVAVGANVAADVLGQAVDLIGGTYPTDFDERAALLDQLEEATWNALAQFDSHWPAVEVETALIRAIHEQPDAFWTTPDDRAHEAELLMEYLTELVGAAAAQDPLAATAIADLSIWVSEFGSDDQKRHVQSEQRRLRSLQS